MLEGPAELIRVGPLGHLRQCLKNLLLGVIHVLEQIDVRTGRISRCEFPCPANFPPVTKFRRTAPVNGLWRIAIAP
jgi:hypothetical protein